MRALVSVLLAVPLLLAACGDHQDIATGPATVPDVVPGMAAGADITMDPGGTVCSQPGLTRTGTVRCKSRKLSAALTVVDEGVL